MGTGSRREPLESAESVSDMGNHVFVCYARLDQAFVLRLAGELRRKGVPVWVDQWDIAPGLDWDREIDRALYDCDRMMIVLSPVAVESREVRAELRTALDAGKIIVPVLHQECHIPRQLSLIQRVDFIGREPDSPDLVAQLAKVLGAGDAAAPAARNKPEIPDFFKVPRSFDLTAPDTVKAPARS